MNVFGYKLKKVLDAFRYLSVSPFTGCHRRGKRVPRIMFGYGIKSSNAAYLKAEKLKALFGNATFDGNILYICSGNIPLWFCKRAKRDGARIILNQNGVYYPGWYGGGYEDANRRHLSGHYNLADYIVFQSRFCEESARRYLGEPRCPSEVLYNPVDTNEFYPGSHGADGLSPVFLSTGNFYSEVKVDRLRLLLDAFRLVRKQIPNAQLTIAGIVVPELLAIIPNGRDGILYAGPYSQKNAASIYRQADIYVSTQFNDCSPSAVLEAMSSGLPIVYLDCGGTPELVGGAGVGVHVERSWEKFVYPTPQEYAKGMLDALLRQKELSVLARNRAVELFDVLIWKQQHERIFAEVLR